MATHGCSQMTTPTSAAAVDLCATNDEGEHVSSIMNEILDGKNAFFDLPDPDKLTGEMWTLKFHCMRVPPENGIATISVDRAYITFYNVMFIKMKLGFSGRDFLFYKKRCGNDQARLEALDYADQANHILSENEGEKTIRFLLTKNQPRALEVSITPMKRPRQRPNIDESASRVPIHAYKEWLAALQQDHPETDLRDDYRDETIQTYKEWLRQQGNLPEILSYIDQHSNDEENHGSNEPRADWPSHARCHRKKYPASSGAFKKEGRGTLKGITAANKRFKSGDQKLSIEFSSRLGGPIGPNTRAFVDEVVLFTKKKAPLIGVKKWRDIDFSVRCSIASNILQRWDFPSISNDDAREKIWSIAKERYRGWRSALSSTYKAYNTYAERMKNKPEEVDIVEWHYLMLYFGSEKFQEISTKNSENRQQQKTKHIMGSKTFSRISYEQRDPETGEEPSDLSLWMSTHMKNGQWSDDASKTVYDNACQKICEIESQTKKSSISREEENVVFQSTFKETIRSKANRLYGHGYLSKYPTRSHIMNSQFLEQARATARTNQKNIELEGEVQQLKEKLATEVAERERLLQEKIQQLQEAEERKRQTLKEEMMKEMLAALAEQRDGTLPQTHRESIIPIEPHAAAISGVTNNKKSLSQINKGNGPTTFISSHSLRNAVTRRVHARSERSEQDTL